MWTLLNKVKFIHWIIYRTHIWNDNVCVRFTCAMSRLPQFKQFAKLFRNFCICVRLFLSLHFSARGTKFIGSAIWNEFAESSMFEFVANILLHNRIVQKMRWKYKKCDQIDWIRRQDNRRKKSYQTHTYNVSTFAVNRVENRTNVMRTHLVRIGMSLPLYAATFSADKHHLSTE